LTGRKKNTTRAGHNEATPVKEIVEDLTPLDVAILEHSPDQGSKLGYHWLGPQVPTLVELLNKDVPVDHRVTSDQVAGRLASLEHLGLIKRVTVQPLQGGKAVQVTPRGRDAQRVLTD
jgi:DNA-binding HxlR family transcriptional regulator